MIKKLSEYNFPERPIDPPESKYGDPKEISDDGVVVVFIEAIVTINKYGKIIDIVDNNEENLYYGIDLDQFEFNDEIAGLEDRFDLEDKDSTTYNTIYENFVDALELELDTREAGKYNVFGRASADLTVRGITREIIDEYEWEEPDGSKGVDYEYDYDISYAYLASMDNIEFYNLQIKKL